MKIQNKMGQEIRITITIKQGGEPIIIHLEPGQESLDFEGVKIIKIH